MRNEEGTQVDHQKHEDDRSGEAHVAGEPSAVLGGMIDGIALRTCLTVAPGQVKSVDRMKDDATEECEFDGADQDISDKEFSVLVEGFAAVHLIQLEVSVEVFQQEEAKEQPRQSHDQFSTDGGVEHAQRGDHSVIGFQRCRPEPTRRCSKNNPPGSRFKIAVKITVAEGDFKGKISSRLAVGSYRLFVLGCRFLVPSVRLPPSYRWIQASGNRPIVLSLIIFLIRISNTPQKNIIF